MATKWLRLTYENFEEWANTVLLTVLVVVVFLQVFGRFVPIFSVDWAEELSRYLFVWILYLGASTGVKKYAHIRLNLIPRFAPPGLAIFFSFLSDLIWLAFNGVMIYAGIQLFWSSIVYPFHSAVMDVSMALVYIIIPLCFFLMSVRLAQNILIDTFHIWRGNQEFVLRRLKG
jgi:C4-dicarboxylate transporter DctQ subunit